MLTAPEHMRGKLVGSAVTELREDRNAWVADRAREGWDVDEIAAALGLSDDGVKGIMRQNGIDAASPFVESIAAPLLRQGLGVEDIAVRRRIPVERVRATVARMQMTGALKGIYRGAASVGA